MKLRVFRGALRCDGSRTRLLGVWFVLGTAARFVAVESGTVLFGSLSRRRGRDVFSLVDSRTRFVGRLSRA